MTFCNHLRLLMWKNLLLQRRAFIVSIFEVIVPLIFAGVILAIKKNATVESGVTDATFYTISPVLWKRMSNLTMPGEDKIDKEFEVGFTPITPLTQRIMEDVRKCIQAVLPHIWIEVNESLIETPLTVSRIKGFATEKEMELYYIENNNISRHSIVFKGLGSGLDTLPDSVTYFVRTITEDSPWLTKYTYNFFPENSPMDSAPKYENSGALWMQALVAQALMREKSGNSSLNLENVYMQRMPFPPYIENRVANVLGSFFPWFIIVSFILSVVHSTKNIVLEKERKLKESMKLMGVMSSAFWVSWFITCYIYLALGMGLFAFMFGYHVENVGPVLAFSDVSVFYAFLLCYAASIVSFCFMISVFVQRANIGAAVSGILFFVTFLPSIGVPLQDISYLQKMCFCLIFNMAMTFGATIFAMYEVAGEGVRWSNVALPVSVDIDFSLKDAMVMLLVDTAIHLLITWYMDNVWPGEFGIAKPYHFFITKSYWCGATESEKDEDNLIDRGQEDAHFERELVGINAGVKIHNLRKRFGSHVAVNNLSLNLYEGQITVLLGHNGAGKTTTMSILTGFIPPTSGTAIMNGYDIRTDIDSVRKSLGLCPQHNILFDTLTVEEHLIFFAKLKGCPCNRVREEVNKTVREIGLEQKRHAMSSTLSGGQKRKLSVGIALINGSKIVILDEPTTGMDPAARRQTWDVLRKYRAGRTILLTTHFMDEADVLGDRIAIMAEGVIKCCGTSIFLKKLYGTGYHLVIVKTSHCKVSRLTEVIQEALPGGMFENEINEEVSYLLPDDQTALFPGLFRILEERKDELGIRNFGAKATTMEDVFLKVGESAAIDDDAVVKRPEMKDVANKTFNNKTSPWSTPDDSPATTQHVVASQSATSSDTSEDKDTFLLHGTGTDPKVSSSNRNSSSTSSIQLNGDASSQSEIKHDRRESGAHDYTCRSKPNSPAKQRNDILDFSRGYTKLSGCQLQCSRFRGLLVKKAIYFWRNRVITFFHLLLPVMFTLLGLMTKHLENTLTIEPPLTFDLKCFSGTIIPYSKGTSPDPTVDTVVAKYTSQFANSGHTPVGNDINATMMNDHFLKMAQEMGTFTFSSKVIIGAAFSSNGFVIAYFNGQTLHSTPISLAYVLNALGRFYIGNDFTITSGFNPLPQRKKIADKHEAAGNMLYISMAVTFSIAFGMAFLPSLSIFSVIKERISGARHMQVVSGVRPEVFWLANLVWDFLAYLLPCVLVLVAISVYQTAPFTDGSNLLVVGLVLALSGWASLPLMYLLHFFFHSAPTGSMLVLILTIITSLTLPMTVQITRFLKMNDKSEKLSIYFGALFPNFCMAISLNDITMNHYTLSRCIQENYTVTCEEKVGPCCKKIGKGCGTSVCFNFTENYLDWEYPGVGRPVSFMALQGVIFLILTLIFEHRVLHMLWDCCCGAARRAIANLKRSDVPEDDDVAEEKKKINAAPASVLSKSYSLLLVNLYKQYGSFLAVDNICVGISEQECFGLLGQNGAGKTTTFKMLTGDVMVTGGNAYLKGFSVKTDLKQVQANIGYCPQFDALLEQMTASETLTLYARLRGVPEALIKGMVDGLIDILMLRPHANKRCGQYSGGNKRKLSAAMALVGDPHFVLLDEPSSGMDPAARRHLWNVLSEVRASGRTLVLTSHSMEECEALCTRIAIMVNGRFVCLGSQQHLKSKFGQGYTLIAQMELTEDGDFKSHDPFVALVQASYPSARIFDAHQGYVHLQVPDPSVHLADVFTLMEHAKRELNVRDYAVHQTTLEQVFLAFVKQQLVHQTTDESCLSRFPFCCC